MTGLKHPLNDTRSDAPAARAPDAAATFPRAWLPGATPDWSAIDREITCPRCDYDLRTLREPRCPECGLEFEWHDIFDALFTVSPWLFEHQWNRRPVRTFLRTLVATLNPGRFWRKLPLQLRINRFALGLQLLAAGPFALVLYLSLLGASALAILAWGVARPLPPTSAGAMTLESQLLGMLFSGITNPITWRFGVQSLVSGLAFVVVSFAVLLTLRQTLARCRVRGAQLLRVVSTAAPGWFAIGAFIGFLLTLHETRQSLLGTTFFGASLDYPLIEWWFFGAVSILLAVPFWWFILARALGRYLRLPRAWFVALLTTFAALIAAITGPIFWIAFVIGRY